MDDFGVLVQTYGIRPQGKSAPMAASKAAAPRTANMDPPNSIRNSNPDQFDPFGFGFNQKPQSYANVDVLEMPGKSSNGGGGVGGLDFDIEAAFKGSMNLNNTTSSANVVDDNDTIWGFSGQVSSNGAFDGGDLLSSDPVADYLGNLGKLGSGSGSSSRLNENKGSRVDTDFLIPGFGMSSSTNERAQAFSTRKNSGSSSIDDLQDFVSGGMKKKANANLDVFKINIPKQTFKEKSVEPNLIDTDLDGFGGGSIHRGKAESVSQNLFEAEAPDLESFFEVHSQKSKPVSKETTRNRKTEEVPDLFSGTPVSTKPNLSPGNSHGDFPFFGVASTSTQFEEFEGESEDRRRARLAHYQSTQARMAEALVDLNEREFRAQREQEERHRIAEAMDMEIKQWAARKEGNLRALLSSLQQVLAPELGWKAVSLTDLITSSQVKIAYKKAALCVHPDKVQQKGANLQQKYVAEKVFDLLKEAWNKFNSEELR